MDTPSSLTRPLADRLAPYRPWWRHPLKVWPYTWASLGWFVAAYVTMVGLWTLAGHAILRWLEPSALGRREVDVNRWFEAERTDGLTTLAHLGSGPSDTPTVIILLAFLLVAIPLTWRRWHGWAFLVGALALQGAVYTSSNFLVGRPRPPVERLEVIVTESFPSGHVSAATTFYLGSVIVIWWHVTNRAARLAVVVVGAVVPMIVAVSRLYLGVHFISDIVAGALLGLTSITVALTIARRGLADTVEESTEPVPPHTARLDLAAVDAEQSVAVAGVTPGAEVDT